MLKTQFYLTIAGIALLCGLFFFVSLETTKSDFPHNETTQTSLNITDFIQKAKLKLPAAQLENLSKLENNISRGDIRSQKVQQYSGLADFWKDSAKGFLPYFYYLSEAAKLDNSEKNLTFAARLILDSMRNEEVVATKSWEAETAASLFERALLLDSANDDLRVGLGSCYVYGKGMIGDATETMKGIQQLLQVVRKDSTNMKAQMVLGIGGVISRQYSKAIDRLIKVVTTQPNNLEAISWLADGYASAGNKTEAIKWYEYSKKLVNNSGYSKEVDGRIKAINEEH